MARVEEKEVAVEVLGILPGLAFAPGQLSARLFGHRKASSWKVICDCGRACLSCRWGWTWWRRRGGDGVGGHGGGGRKAVVSLGQATMAEVAFVESQPNCWWCRGGGEQGGGGWRVQLEEMMEGEEGKRRWLRWHLRW